MGKSSLIEYNPIGRLLNLIGRKAQDHPVVSTTFAALLLSSLWTAAWFIVFFFTTWKFDLTTKSNDFVCIFWMSIAAEALIRWAENTNFIAALSKPHEDAPLGDNQDFRLPKASVMFLIIILAMYILTDFLFHAGLDQSKFVFSGQQGERSFEAMAAMVVGWKETVIQSNVSLPLLVGTFFRAMIYKRSHKRGR